MEIVENKFLRKNNVTIVIAMTKIALYIQLVKR